MCAEESRFRLETAAELRLARDRLDRASRMARLGAWEFDVLNQEMIWSDMLWEIHELPPDFRPGLDPQLLERFYRRPECREKLYTVMEGALERGEAYDIEVRMTTGKGREIWVRTMGQPEMQDGRCVRIHGIFQDIDAHKRLELELASARAEAEAATAAKSQFVASVSHEIRTPLHSVLGFAELMERTDLNETQKLYMRSVRQSAAALQDLLNDVLDFSRIEAEQLQLYKRPGDLRVLAEQLEDILSIDAVQKGLELRITVDPGLPQRVWMDAKRLRQILLNLLGNAIKYTPAGRVSLDIDRVAGTDSAETVTARFRICDTGPGIPREERALIFDLFHQGGNAAEDSRPGTGLGLAIAARLAALMDARIQLQDPHGSTGSCFVFALDLPVAGDEALPAETPAVGAGVAADLTACRPTVLIVDDNPGNRLLAGHVLQVLMPNAGILEAAEGEGAVELFRKTRPDLVLMDVQMPGVDGPEAARRIRALASGRAAPILALTAGAATDERERCLAAGMDLYLSKPATIEQLERALRLALAADGSFVRPASEAPAEINSPNTAEFDRLDFAKLLQSLQGDRDTMRAILKMTADGELRRLGATLAEAAAANQPEEARHAAHRLKGAAATACFTRLASMAHEFEALTPWSQSVARSAAAAVLSEIEAVEALVRAELQKTEAAAD